MQRPDTVKIIYLLTILTFFISFFSKVYTKNEKSTSVPPKVKISIIEDLAGKIKENYVYPEKGEKMAKALKHTFAQGSFDRVETFPDFADSLTNYLRTIVNDKHLRIKTSKVIESDIMFPVLEGQQKHGITATKILEGNIGYLAFNSFPRLNKANRKAISASMEKLEDTKAIIMDLRNNGGGDPATVQLYCSYFFDENPILLNSLYLRPENITRDYYTLKTVEGRKMPHKPLYILTSDYTFSGAEEFCYNMQTRERALVIGETTGGGAHPVNAFKMDNRLTAIIPVGRAINPITGTNWEGTGIQPNISCDATEALQNAINLINDASD